MSASLPEGLVWPPFPIEQLPIELQGLLEDFHWAPLHPHPQVGNPLVTVVVPCFNPDPQLFSQLLLSLRQQVDQQFDLLLVNDGCSDDAWRPIQAQLHDHPWIQVLDLPGNTGISNALNAALDHVATPYVALVDQDDVLHPGALALVRRYLETHPDCGLLYSDHLVFGDDGCSAQYIPKFPWNPEALLEFNFLIHLTVVRADLYRACGGMDSRFDGIQDWEFYLRLAPLLSPATVGYLPLPLYAWRFSDRSVASSAQPKPQLLERARQFLAEAHARWGGSTRVAELHGASDHYRFRVDRGPAAAALPQLCNVLVLAGAAGTGLISATLESLLASAFPIGRVVVALDPGDSASTSLLPLLQQQPCGPELLRCSLRDLADHLPTDRPLLVLQAGALLENDPDHAALPAWLERCDRWDLLTLPCFNLADGSCLSAGYSRGVADQSVYLPQGVGLSQQAYGADFASFGHTRPVDLPSPAFQLLRSSCLRATLDACRLGDGTVCQGWWRQLAQLNWRCCCLPVSGVKLMPDLVAAEQGSLALRGAGDVSLMDAQSWLGAQAGPWGYPYAAALRRALEQGEAGRVHPLHVQAFFAEFLHPAVLHAARSRCGRTSLLPALVRRPVVMLIPTELNARSNGHACMLSLALQLQQAGYSVHLLPFKPYTFFRHYYQRLRPIYRQLSFIIDPAEVPGAVLLAPESAPSKLVQRLRRHYDEVLWWLLAPVGLLNPSQPEIRPGDRLVAFSEFTLPSQLDYLFVHPPADPLLLHLASTHVPHAGRQPQIALYTGKGRLKRLSRSLHRHLLAYQVVLITRSFPATKAGLIRLLARCDGLISCDPMTNLSLEAANLGVPTYLPANPFPARCYHHFPVDLQPFITDSPGAFIAQLQREGPAARLSVEPLKRESAKATALMDLLTADPEPLAARSYRVDDNTLRQIQLYRRQLIQARAIQVVRDGESISSAFSGLYVLSLKLPYVFHCCLCRVLELLDRAADFLLALGLFRVLYPPIRIVGRALHLQLRRMGWTSGRVVG
jgi:hypothetical protein